MKIRNLLALFCCQIIVAQAAPTHSAVIFPGDTAQTLNLVWPATPGLRYEVKESTNLQSWTTAPGYPAPAFGPAQQMPFSSTDRTHFYKVNQLDDQPPVIASQYPADGGFAVPRFANLTLQLTDATGIDPNSLQLTVGSLGTFTLTNAQLTFSNGVLTFLNGGSIPLGGWGTNVTASLVMADMLGHFATNTWSFTLESQPQTVTNLFVFGSPHAQRTGQQIGNIPTRVLAARAGPIAAGAGDPWTLTQVATNYLVLSYTNTAPGFTVGQYVCNLTPASPAEIFYRKITSLSDNSGSKQLTLFTVDVPLTDIATNGSASISADSMIFQTDTNGMYKPAYAKTLSVGGTLNFPPIGCSFDGADFSLQTDIGSLPIVSFTADEMHFWLYPSIRCSMETSWGHLQKLEVIASGKVESACVFDAQFLLAGVAAEKKIRTIHVPGGTVFLGFIGPVPVFIEVGGDFDLKAQAQAYATMKFRGGIRQTMDASVGLQYSAPDTMNWVRDFQLAPTEIITPSADITANGVFQLSLEPKVDALVDALGGIAIGISPNLKLTAQAGITEPITASLTGEVDLTIGAAGPVLDAAQQALNTDWSFSYPILGPYQLWSWPPAGTVVGSGGASTLAFAEQPASQTIPVGGNANFFCTVNSSSAPSYQWFCNGIPMSGQTSRTLSIPGVNSGHSGNYSVRVSAGGQTTNSATATLTVLPASVQSGKSGLVAWYPFNGNANDASGNGHNGVLHGSPNLIPDRNGKESSAYSFNGTSDYILIPNNPALATPYMTVSMWVNLQSYEHSSLISDYGWNYANPQQFCGYFFNISDQGKLDFRLASGPIYTGVYLTGSATIPLSQWVHVTATYDGNNSKVYVNGFLDGVVNANYSSYCWTAYGDTLIGSQSWNPSQCINGQINDVRIYNRALSDSEILALYNASLPAPAPSSGMALIPAGSFQMGDAADNNSYGDAPVHTVYVSAFYMDQYDVTEGLWAQVYNWAVNHGYSFDLSGSVPGSAYSSYSKGPNYPVVDVDWYDCVKWCNARSEMEGRTPAYYTTSAQTVVYRFGQVSVDNNSVKWGSGYRLPTEAEWEKAARGGLSGQRFPWGNTISWNQANYYGYPLAHGGSYAYDLATAIGYDPTFATGNLYTSPVNYFAPNGYGLYDMAGNVYQWCWDWYGTYGSGSDPRGPTSGSYRVIRGGSWYRNAFPCRTALRGIDNPGINYDFGFRSVLPPGQ